MKIVIIGNGISGITAARHIRKLSKHPITVISSETDHFYSRTALMYIYMGHMGFKETKPYEDWFWTKNNINLKRAHINQIDTEQKVLHTNEHESIAFDKLILATGSASNFFGWPGQDLNGVQGLYNYQDLELLEKSTQNCQRAVIVGGGLIGIELAEMLHSRHIPVTFLVRESSFWNNVLPAGESDLINRHIREHGFDLRLGVNLEAIIDDGTGNVKAVKVKETAEEIDCQLVGITAGVHPNIDFIKNTSNIETNRGVLINHYFETNIKDIYAIGDCAEFREPLPQRRPIEQVWYTGRMHGEVVAQNICGQRQPYQPGPWFNSAKFLDIEYQTYGMIMPQIGENETSLYWENLEGDKCVHIVYDKTSKTFIGINTFGIRMRHHIFDKWLREKASVETVLENLAVANFDPEFFAVYENEIIQQYNKQANTQLKVKAKRGVFNLFKLLNKS